MTSSSPSPAISPELAALAAEGAALDAETAPAPLPQIDPATGQPVPEPEPINHAEDAEGICTIIFGAVGAIYPSTKAVVTKEVKAEIAGLVAPVLEKWGVNMGAIFGKWGPEIALGFGLAKIALPLAEAISTDRAARAAAKEQPARIERGQQTPVIEKTDPASLHTKA